MKYCWTVFFFMTLAISFSQKTFAAQVDDVLRFLRGQEKTRDLVFAAEKLAKKEHKTLQQKIHPSDRTYLDLSYKRHFYGSTPWNVEFDVKWTIHLNLNQSLIESAVLLGHELYHLVKRPHEKTIVQFFALDQSVFSYLDETLFGVGGEKEALLFECELREIWDEQRYQTDPYCQKIRRGDDLGYYHAGGSQVKEKMQKWWEQVGAKFRGGDDYQKWQKKINEAEENAQAFLSSATGESYLSSSWQEFIQSKKDICRFEERRLERWRKSADSKERQIEGERLGELWQVYCSNLYLES
jgi:hypothetical protein